jgi:hypothetical protein
MKDPIIEAIRKVRARRSIQLGRDVRKAIEDTHRDVMSVAEDVEWIVPGVSYRATFRKPIPPDDVPRRPKKARVKRVRGIERSL